MKKQKEIVLRRSSIGSALRNRKKRKRQKHITFSEKRVNIKLRQTTGSLNFEGVHNHGNDVRF